MTSNIHVIFIIGISASEPATLVCRRSTDTAAAARRLSVVISANAALPLDATIAVSNELVVCNEYTSTLGCIRSTHMSLKQ